jgi:intracellular sulfur oxidation DsrE/DsrF family protein
MKFSSPTKTEDFMTEKFSQVPRRSFLSRIGIGAAALGAGVAASMPAAAAQTNGFQARRHTVDAWMDAPQASHRIVIDSSSPDSGGSALLFAANTLIANKTGYNLDPSDIAIIVVFRHDSTAFGYSDAIWEKYGEIISDLTDFTDPKTDTAPATNLYNTNGYESLPNSGITIDILAQQGVQFAICNMATQYLAEAIAEKTKGDPGVVYRELIANRIPNSHLAAAGVLAVNRAQEYGYTLLTAL